MVADAVGVEAENAVVVAMLGDVEAVAVVNNVVVAANAIATTTKYAVATTTMTKLVFVAMLGYLTTKRVVAAANAIANAIATTPTTKHVAVVVAIPDYSVVDAAATQTTNATKLLVVVRVR